MLLTNQMEIGWSILIYGLAALSGLGVLAGGYLLYKKYLLTEQKPEEEECNNLLKFDFSFENGQYFV
jgi:hypothetical protein